MSYTLEYGVVDCLIFAAPVTVRGQDDANAVQVMVETCMADSQPRQRGVEDARW